MLNSTKKSSYSLKIVRKDNEFVVRKTTVFSEYDSIRGRFVKVDTKEEFLPLSAMNPTPVKKVKTQVMFTREATDSVTLLPIRGIFVADLTLEVSSECPSGYITSANGLFFFNDLENGSTTKIYLGKSRLVHITRSEGKRISVSEAQELLRKGIKIYSELPDGTLITMLNVAKTN